MLVGWTRSQVSFGYPLFASRTVLAMGNQSLLGFLNTVCWCYLSELGGVNHTCMGTSVELTKQGAITHFQEFTPFVLFTWVLVVVDPVCF